MDQFFDVLLLLALPASGKSEVRKYLEERNPEQFHIGPTVQLDDYPYVHAQIRIDEELARRGHAPLFHHADSADQQNGPFIDAHENCGLIELLNDDFDELLRGHSARPEKAARALFAQLDRASARGGAHAKLMDLPEALLGELEATLEDEAQALYEHKARRCPTSIAGKTVVIEFARGGPANGELPLPAGYGYGASLPHLSAEILRRAAILYIWVEPEESRRKNRARARPDAAGSILFHGVPESVMLQEYGACDMTHLVESSDIPGTVRVETRDEVFHLPAARFDNRSDLTTFLRDEPSSWSPGDVTALHEAITGTCDRLWQRYRARR